MDSCLDVVAFSILESVQVVHILHYLSTYINFYSAYLGVYFHTLVSSTHGLFIKHPERLAHFMIISQSSMPVIFFTLCTPNHIYSANNHSASLCLSDFVSKIQNTIKCLNQNPQLIYPFCAACC